MAQPITVVDAFTDKAFSGNPAAVCVLSEERDKRWMQLVARAMNHAKTAVPSAWADAPFLAYQASPRGGMLEVEFRGERVLLRGHAVTVLRGELTS